MFDKNFTGEEKIEKEQNLILNEILEIFKTDSQTSENILSIKKEGEGA
jgi:hypothetical protein